MSGKKPVEERVRDAAQEFRDPEMENQLLAYFLRTDPSTSSEVNRDWISDVVLQDIYRIISDLKFTMSKAMVTNELRDRGIMTTEEEGLYEDVIDQLFEVDISGFNDKNTVHMKKQLLRLYESRTILITCGSVIASMRKFNLDDAKKKLAKVSRPTVLADSQSSGYYLDDYGQRVEIINDKARAAEENEDMDAGVKTGIHQFDRVTSGMMKKEFGVIAGVTGVGKTAALLEFGVSAWENDHNVMFCSGEMSKDLIGFRIDSRITEIPGNKFRNATLDDHDFKKWDSRITAYRSQRESILFVASYSRGFTVQDIERDLQRIWKETGRVVDVVCVDYVNIMSSTSWARSNWENQAGAIWDFKNLCAEYNLVGWTAAQVTDDAYGKELYDAQDLKYARAISEAAPVIIALIRTAKDKIEKRMKLQVIKMRNAELPSRLIVLTPRFSIMQIDWWDRGKGTLSGMTGGTIDILPSKRPAKKLKPAKSHGGK